MSPPPEPPGDRCHRNRVIQNCCSAALLLGVFIAPAVALAQTAPVSPQTEEQYRQLVRQAVQQYDDSHFEEAKVLFAEAHRVFPNARTLRGLGMVADAMRDYVRAVQYLESALASRVRPLDPSLAKEARDVLARARSYVGSLEVDITPSDARLTIDGWPVKRAPNTAIALNPGPHEIVALAQGFQTLTRFVRVESGAALRVEIKLPRDGTGGFAEATTSETPAPSGATELDASSGDARATHGAGIAPWIVVAISGAVAVGGSVILGVALNDVATVEDSKPLAEWSRVENKYERSAGMSTAGIVMLTAGIAGIAAGLTWYVLDDDESDTLALRVSPGAMELRGSW